MPEATKPCVACFADIDARATICRYCQTSQAPPASRAKLEEKHGVDPSPPKKRGSGCGTALLVGSAIAVAGLFMCFRAVVDTPHPDSRAWKNDPANAVCAKWSGLSQDLKRGAVATSLQPLLGSRIDEACVVRRIDELVRRVNGWCPVSNEVLANLLVNESRRLCP